MERMVASQCITFTFMFWEVVSCPGLLGREDSMEDRQYFVTFIFGIEIKQCLVLRK